jgi:MarR family transcriptional regulator for hemolysin
VPAPAQEPIGLLLTRASKAVSRAFDAALAEAGGSLPTWLILLSVKTGRSSTQRELAAAVGIEGATLTHHLDGLERRGLLVRTREPANRRVQRVTLTDEGEAAFLRLRQTAVAFDRRLRDGLAEDDLTQARAVLARLALNVS